MQLFSPRTTCKIVLASLLGIPFAATLTASSSNWQALSFIGPAQAAKGVCKDGTPPPCKPSGGEGEAAANRLSYPVILSDNTTPGGFPVDAPWTFAQITDVATQCTTGVQPGSAVPESLVCYYDGQQVWWLSQRESNFWKAFSPPDPDTSSVVVITALDWGDLLESSPRLNARRIRTEVTLYKEANGVLDPDADFKGYIASGFFQAPPYVSCPSSEEGDCFAAFNMSGAVPGTDQSINEIQGTDFGGTTAHPTATTTLIDPTAVKSAATANDYNGNPATVTLPIGFHATVYSRCARLLIQQITGNPAQVVWDSANHRWGPDAQVALAVVDIKAWQDTYSAEINASGTLIYGFNWDAQGADAGVWRLTYLLDNGLDGVADQTGEHCNVTPNTVLTEHTLVANPGEVAVAKIIPLNDSRLDGDTSVAGLTYLDVDIKTRGGGGKGRP